MKNLILIVADSHAQALLDAYFTRSGYRVIAITRTMVKIEQQLVIDEGGIFLEGVGHLVHIDAALILDSGFMWPMPILQPTKEEWEANRSRFDDYLRDERENLSFWYSLMEILNRRARICVNPQTAFEFEALKPFAFAKLAAADIPIPPFMACNDPEALQEFMHKNPGNYLRLPFNGNETNTWLSFQQVLELPLQQEPVMLQSLENRDSYTIVAVDGQITASCPPMPSLESLWPHLSAIQELLRMPLAHLVLRQAASDWVLSDFSPAPPLSELTPRELEATLVALEDYLNRKLDESHP